MSRTTQQVARVTRVVDSLSSLRITELALVLTARPGGGATMGSRAIPRQRRVVRDIEVLKPLSGGSNVMHLPRRAGAGGDRSPRLGCGGSSSKSSSTTGRYPGNTSTTASTLPPPEATTVHVATGTPLTREQMIVRRTRSVAHERKLTPLNVSGPTIRASATHRRGSTSQTRRTNQQARATQHWHTTGANC